MWIRADDGAEGFGFTVGSRFKGGAWIIAEALEQGLTPLLVGRDAQQITALWESMYFQTLLIGQRGAVMRAMSAVDVALWDLQARIAGLPLSALLGQLRTEVPAYASGGYYYTDGDFNDELRHMEQEIGRAIDLGFRHAKIKVGRLPLHQDLQRCHLVIDMLPGPGSLAIDANHAWRSSAEALTALRPFDELGLLWIEEPLLPEQTAGYARLSRKLTTPLATGEIDGGRAAFRTLVEGRCVEVLQADATVVGGITEWLRIAGMASCYDIALAPHWVPDIHVHLGAAIPAVSFLEYFHPSVGVFNFDMLLAERLQVSDGKVRIPDGPGHGIRLDGDAVRKFTVTK